MRKIIYLFLLALFAFPKVSVSQNNDKPTNYQATQAIQNAGFMATPEAHRTIQVNADGDVVPSDINLAFADATGYSSVNKFGRSINVDTATDTDIWDGADGSTSTAIWAPPTTARIHAIASTDANDDAVGTGARTVEIQGLDRNWETFTDTVTLDNAAAVNTSDSFVRIFRMKVLTVGSGGANAGIITATAATDGTVTAAIQAGNNQTLMTIYTVPANKTAYVTHYYCSVNRASPSNVSFDIRLLVKPDADVSTAPYQLKHIVGMFVNGNNYLEHDFYPYMKVGEKSDIVMRATDCTDNNTDVSAGFDIILVDN